MPSKTLAAINFRGSDIYYDEDDDEEDYEPPVMIVTRLPRLLGVNVQK